MVHGRHLYVDVLRTEVRFEGRFRSEGLLGVPANAARTDVAAQALVQFPEAQNFPVILYRLSERFSEVSVEIGVD